MQHRIATNFSRASRCSGLKEQLIGIIVGSAGIPRAINGWSQNFHEK